MAAGTRAEKPPVPFDLYSTIKKIMEKTPGKYRLEKWLFYGTAAAAAALALRAFSGKAPASIQNFSYYANRGELIFHAVHSKAASYSMPLLSFLASAAHHLAFDPALPAMAAALLLCLAAYGLGAKRGGPARGAIFALAAAVTTITCAAPEVEQLLYSLFLLVFLSLELRRQEEGGLTLSVAAGLAASASMLIRSPLFAFPPLALLFQRLSSRPKAGWLPAAALFLVCAYLPLAPWARLNNSLFGHVILFEEERSTCNIITGASGIVFTIEGDARSFAGLSRTESVYPWAVKTVLSSPGRYASAVVRRAWHVFLMFPLLFLLAGAGLYLGRRSPEARALAFFSGYFIFIHCLLSIEERYFYPLRYPLSLLAAGGVWALIKKAGLPSEERGKDYFTAPIFALILAAMAGTLAVVWRYPAAARPGLIAVTRGLEKYPSDSWLHRKKGEILLSLDLTREGLEALGRDCSLSREQDRCYITGVLGSDSPGEPPRVGNYYELLLVKLMRELELGKEEAARQTLAAALKSWEGEKNAIKGVQFKEDARNLQRIKESNKTFWDMDISAALVYLPPEKRAGALERLSKLTFLTPKLRTLQLQNNKNPSAPEKKELAGLEQSLALELPESEFDWKGTARALAAELLRGGPLTPARQEGELGLLLALDLGPEKTASSFETHSAPAGRAARAAAAAWLAASSGKPYSFEARALADADPSNFAYTLALLKAENFSPGSLKAAAENLKKNPYPLAAGALAAARKGDPAVAATLARAAAKAGKLGELGWNTAMLALQESGNYKAELELAELALREHPDSSQLMNNRGVTRHLSGDAAGARLDFEAAVRAQPGNVSALMNLGAVLEAAGEKEKAREIYGKAASGARSAQQKVEAGRALARLEAAGYAGEGNRP